MLLVIASIFCGTTQVSATTVVDSLSRNTFEWSETTSPAGKAKIANGVLTVSSNSVKHAVSKMTPVDIKLHEPTHFETHNEAPITLSEPFQIDIKLSKVGKFKKSNLTGLQFNYLDNGNYYCVVFTDKKISFLRYIDGEQQGVSSQRVNWKDPAFTKKTSTVTKNAIWTLKNDGQKLVFAVNGVVVYTLHELPEMKHHNIGFYCFGKQKLVVDSITYSQQ